MTPKEAVLAVRAALDAGREVHDGDWLLTKDQVGQYLMTWSWDEYCIGVAGKAGTEYEYVPNFQIERVTVDGMPLAVFWEQEKCND